MSMQEEKSPMDQLFGSKTRTKLLKLFMSNPNRSFYVREITRKIEEQINSVRRELANMLSLGLISSDSSNNKLYYEVNQTHEHYEALRMLFTGKKSVSTTEKPSSKKDKESSKPVAPTAPAAIAIEVDQDVWDKAGKIVGLLYAGSFTRDSISPVDVLIIGDVPVARAEAAVTELEKQQNKELRYAIMEVQEWTYRKQVNDKFYAQVMSAKKQIIKDEQQLFEQK